uniref:Stomatin (EPB72)-like 3a n=1 Tax=Oncorhynchus kisutch TaxID=8019 RepID=A0A8C7GMJ7_ONCKI
MSRLFPTLTIVLDLHFHWRKSIHSHDSFHSHVNKSSGSLGCCGWLLFGISLIFTVFLFPITIFMCVKIVKEYERAVIFRLGRIADKKPKGPGIFFVLPCTDTFVKVDLRTVSFDIPPQEVLNTSTSNTLYHCCTVRTVSCTSSCLQHHNTIIPTRTIVESLDEATDPWGIKVERVEIKDVKLPHQLREARAKVIAAEGEMNMNAFRALKEASLVIAESPSGLQLRYLQTLTTIAAEKNSTIIFPLPIDMVSHFMQRK